MFAPLGAPLTSHGKSEQLNLSYNQFHSMQVDVDIRSDLFMLKKLRTYNYILDGRKSVVNIR